jgi:hypothetical protein
LTPYPQEFAILAGVDGDVESDVPTPAGELKAANFGDLDARLDRARLRHGSLLPPADLLEEMPETQLGFFG